MEILEILAVYWVAANVSLFMMMKIDKKKAIQHQYRISEKTLWMIAVAGGALGGTTGMYLFRHKTKHIPFKWGFPLLAILQIVAMLKLS